MRDGDVSGGMIYSKAVADSVIFKVGKWHSARRNTQNNNDRAKKCGKLVKSINLLCKAESGAPFYRS